MEPRLEDLSEETADSYALVLAAAGIAHRVVDTARGWRIDVQPADRPRALAAVARYRDENAADRSPAASPEAGGRQSMAGIGAALFLLGCNLALGLYHPDPALLRRYGAASEAIVGGELYRCVTALLLHAGFLHLLTNLIGLALFATAVCTLAGGGLGCFLLLVSGAVGNGLNALLTPADHLSIGASTAVFGGVGILTAHSFLRLRRQRNRLRAMVPVGGGLALLAFLGSAAHTDVMAHLFGFAAGSLCGGRVCGSGAPPTGPNGPIPVCGGYPRSPGAVLVSSAGRGREGLQAGRNPIGMDQLRQPGDRNRLGTEKSAQNHACRHPPGGRVPAGHDVCTSASRRSSGVANDEVDNPG